LFAKVWSKVFISLIVLFLLIIAYFHYEFRVVYFILKDWADGILLSLLLKLVSQVNTEIITKPLNDIILVWIVMIVSLGLLIVI